nr:MAG TPA: hypothetical protein [Caudoviricetes sp.]
MRDIRIYSLDRHVFNKIPDACIKSWDNGIQDETLGIRDLSGTVNVVIKDVFDIVFSEDNDLVITVIYNNKLSTLVKIPCNSFSCVVIR